MSIKKIIDVRVVRIELSSGDYIDYLCESFTLLKKKGMFAILHLWNGDVVVLEDKDFKDLEVLDGLL